MNRENAMRILKSKLYQRELEKKARPAEPARRTEEKDRVGFTDTKYTLHPYKLVKESPDRVRNFGYRSGPGRQARRLYKGLPDGVRRGG